MPSRREPTLEIDPAEPTSEVVAHDRAAQRWLVYDPESGFEEGAEFPDVHLAPGDVLARSRFIG
jgi:hypothetical protein